MLTKILKSAVFCAPLAMLACGDDSATAPKVEKEEVIKSDTTYVKDTVIIDGEVVIKVDTVVKVDTIVQVKGEEKVPYFVEDTTFSWDKLQDVSSPTQNVGDQVKPESSSSAKGSSSSTKVSSSSSESLISSSSETPSTVSGNVLTDGRDGKQYKLVDVDGKLWMAENIAYEMKNIATCYDSDCDKGMLYQYAALTKVCPAGWHLPNKDEFNALATFAAAAEEAAGGETDWEFWQFGGRMKSATYDFYGQMGFWWLDRSVEAADKDSKGVIFVKKSYDYGDGETKYQDDLKDKGFSVRCIQD